MNRWNKIVSWIMQRLGFNCMECREIRNTQDMMLFCPLTDRMENDPCLKYRKY